MFPLMLGLGLTRATSHIWGKLYLPMFLFRVGLLTLMFIDSLFVLTKPCPSLPTMLKLSKVVPWWLCIGKGAFGVPFIFLQMFLKILQFTPCHIQTHYICMGILCHFCIGWALCTFGDTSMFLIVLLPLQYMLIPY